jgi:hypothetical protein
LQSPERFTWAVPLPLLFIPGLEKLFPAEQLPFPGREFVEFFSGVVLLELVDGFDKWLLGLPLDSDSDLD